MIAGTCRLCGRKSDLVDSHVWPKFAYRRYVANPERGGAFLDVGAEKNSNRQYKFPWFCRACDNETLSGYESYASGLCAAFDERQDDPREYDWRLLPFLVSISWRSALALTESSRGNPDAKLKEAIRRWRQYLSGHKTTVGPFTQHLFVVYSLGCELHKGMGGEVFPRQGLVLSQVGPLHIVGLYGRDRLSLADLRVWETSRVLPGGGRLQPVQVWEVGRTITAEFARLMSRHEEQVKRGILAVGQQVQASG